MFRAGAKCQYLIRWMLGKGRLSIWEDIWMKDLPLSSFCVQGGVPDFVWINNMWEEAGWDEEGLRDLLEDRGVPEEVIEGILCIPFDTGEEDKARWILTSHGNFSLASAWEHVRHRGEEREIFKIIWSKGINPTISVFLWRLLANRIPVDEKVQWRGVLMASKCRCCVNSGSESRLHLFVNGEAAMEVWNHFETWFSQVPPFSWPGQNLEVRLRWWQLHSGNRTKLHISTLIPCLIFWYLWIERNGCVHRETTFRLENVCLRVKIHLKNLVLAGHLGPQQWEGCVPRVDFMRDQLVRRKIKRVEMVQWRPPDWPWLKLNSDGAFDSSRNKAGGGGLLRNNRGVLIEAFYTPLAANSGLEAEMLALLEGILMAKSYGRCLWLETDAEILCSALDKGQLGPAVTRHIMARIKAALKDFSWKITHIRREGNKAADLLASMGKESLEPRRVTGNLVPNRVRALVRLDQMGMPTSGFLD